MDSGTCKAFVVTLRLCEVCFRIIDFSEVECTMCLDLFDCCKTGV